MYVYVLCRAHLFLIDFVSMPVFACVCCLRYRGREWAAACPSPPAEAELVTVYWLGNIRCLQGVCSRWSKLAEWLWQTNSVQCCCKVNNNIKPSQNDFRFSFFLFFFHNVAVFVFGGSSLEVKDSQNSGTGLEQMKACVWVEYMNMYFVCLHIFIHSYGCLSLVWHFWLSVTQKKIITAACGCYKLFFVLYNNIFCTYTCWDCRWCS